MEKHQLVIIGGGSAGIACALGAYEAGLTDIIIVERDFEYGGVLQQCIHTGFGLHTFNEDLSGPAYAEKYFQMIKDINEIKCYFNATVTNIDDNKVLTIQSKKGLSKIQAEAIVLASGCYERTPGAINITGDRVKGVYTAGSAQKYINKYGVLLGKRVFILGSGDIGLIMARRMSLEGAKVLGVAEIMPYSNGLARNIKQCLEDFDIPLYLSHTVESVHGYDKLNSITLIKVDEKLQKIEGSERRIDCDLLLVSVGLIPDNSLIEELGVKLDPKTKGAIIDNNYMTSFEGIFACGNALHVHDLVDYVSIESKRCGQAASEYILNGLDSSDCINNELGNGISYVIPQKFHKGKNIDFMFRSNAILKNCAIHISGNGIDKTINKPAIVPSEMQMVSIKADELKDLDACLKWEIIQ